MTTELDVAQDAAALTVALCDIESVSGNEGPLADAVERALRGIPGLQVDRDGDAVVARTQLGRQERVVIAGHLDTVPVAGNLPCRVEEGRIWGCGSSDMKSGVAVALRLAATVPDPRHDVTYVFYDNEEVEAVRNGLGRLSREHSDWLSADFAILMEPTAGTVEGGCQGNLRADIVVRGRRAHSARAWTGVNAVHAAADVLQRLRSYQAETVEIDGLRYREGLNAVGIVGGVAGNVIPDECRVTLNYRFAPSKSPVEAEQVVRALFDGYEIEVRDSAPAALPGLRHPAAAAFVDMVGRPPRAKLGWTDVARFAELGVPAVNYGPGEPTVAHQREEYCSVEAIRECEQRMRAWLSS